MPAPRKYDVETQDRAVRMYADRIAEGGISQLRARQEVGALLGINPATLRNWIRRDLGEAGANPAGAGESLEAENARLRAENARLRAENARLRAENARLQRANEILKTASAFFASAELDRKLGS
ncbi:transposase [Phytoactinopolyspora limicola]|uniref:transposase n=1 Tax=Phytoactinopolyspora limicola TaxID=2715536 RepID=UPI001408F001|nr:transposase [Phytoactinopolyspora limicola]